MKRICALIIATLLCVVTFTTCVAEGFVLEAMEEPIYYIGRPNVVCRDLEGKEPSVTLHFGEVVEILERHDEYTYIKYGDNQIGKVTTGFILESYYPMLYIDQGACYLSPIPGLTDCDFAYGAAGQRWEEKAVVLYEDNGYIYIVTDEGHAGWTLESNPSISLYTGQVPAGT